MQRKKVGTGLSRKEFLKLGGAGLAGAALLGTAGCGDRGADRATSRSPGGPTTREACNADQAVQQAEQGLQGHLPGDACRHGPVLRQAQDPVPGRGRRHRPHLGDVIWPAQFAINGWISDLTDLFKDTDEFLSGPMQSSTYDGKVWSVPWYTDAGLLYYRQDLLKNPAIQSPPRPGPSSRRWPPR